MVEKQNVISATVLIFLALPVAGLIGYCTNCIAGYRYESADGSCIEYTENTYSEGGLDSCVNCVDNEACSACDITNGFWTNYTAGHEYNPDTGKCTPCPVNNYSEGGSKAKCYNCNDIGISCFSCDSTNDGYCTDCYPGSDIIQQTEDVMDAQKILYQQVVKMMNVIIALLVILALLWT